MFCITLICILNFEYILDDDNLTFRFNRDTKTSMNQASRLTEYLMINDPMYVC